MYYDATDDHLSKEDQARIELARIFRPEWQEVHCRAEQPSRADFQLGDGNRVNYGNGGYGPNRPDGRAQRTGDGVVFQRGSKLTKAATTKAPSGNKFTCRDRQPKKAPAAIGASVFTTVRNMEVIEMYHFQRLLKTFPDLSRDFLIREAKRLSYTEVGVWNIDDVTARRITDPVRPPNARTTS